MKILLFGGSFDPPHLGHEALLKAALRELKPDRTYLVPAHQSPLKSGHQASPGQRLRMARSMRGKFRLGLFELKRRRTSYTFETVSHYKTRHPSAEIWCLLGSDSFASFPRWKHPARLSKDCRWLVGRRPGSPLPRRGLPAHRTLRGVFPLLSSTEIRCRLLAGLDTTKLLSPEVLAQIRRRGLYGLRIHRELKRTLSPQRYEHTLEVARLAVSLAERHGLDPEAAAAAALLHDAGRKFDLSGMVRYARLHHLRVPAMRKIVSNAPLLLHAFISEDLARKRFGVRDPAILSAIRNHTLGAAGMSELDRLLYVADISSEDRGFPGASRIRRLALRNLQKAFVLAVKTKLRYVKDNGFWLHPDSAKLERWSRER